MSTEKSINEEKGNAVLPDVSRSFKHPMLDVWGNEVVSDVVL